MDFLEIWRIGRLWTREELSKFLKIRVRVYGECYGYGNEIAVEVCTLQSAI